MSRTVAVGVLVLALAGLFVPSFVQKSQAAPAGCNNRDLLGSYGLIANGFVAFAGTTPPGIPLAYTGVLEFDGVANFSGMLQTGSGAFFISGGDGTYAVLPDCSGDMVAVLGTIVVFFAKFAIVDSGREVLFISTVAPLGFVGDKTLSGVMKKIK